MRCKHILWGLIRGQSTMPAVQRCQGLLCLIHGQPASAPHLKPRTPLSHCADAHCRVHEHRGCAAAPADRMQSCHSPPCSVPSAHGLQGPSRRASSAAACARQGARAGSHVAAVIVAHVHGAQGSRIL